MDINPISTKRIYQNIIEQFVGLIKDGKLKIGQKLPPERQLAEMFNVSRASIREAFSAMELIGLIEVRPGDGSFITDINIIPFINTIAPLFVKNEIMEKELLEFRKMIELEAVKLAAEKADGERLAELEQTLGMMKSAIEKDELMTGAEADIRFHKKIFELSGNFILIKASECVAYILESSVRFNREKILKKRENSKELYKQHKQIYEAIRQWNPQLATERMEEHLDYVLKMT